MAQLDAIAITLSSTVLFSNHVIKTPPQLQKIQGNPSKQQEEDQR